MDPLAPALEAMRIRQEDEAKAVAKVQAVETEATLRMTLGRLVDLEANENFKWFCETYLRPLVKIEEERSLKPSSAGIQGPVAANRYEMGNTMLTCLQTEKTATENKLLSALKRQGRA